MKTKNLGSGKNASKTQPCQWPGAKAWYPHFLFKYSQCLSLQKSCKYAGISYGTLCMARNTDSYFAKRLVTSRSTAADRLEATAYEIALNGTTDTVYHLGKPCGYRKFTHDTLIIFLLKKLKPEVYSDTEAGSLSAEERAQQMREAYKQITSSGGVPNPDGTTGENTEDDDLPFLEPGPKLSSSERRKGRVKLSKARRKKA